MRELGPGEKADIESGDLTFRFSKNKDGTVSASYVPTEQIENARGKKFGIIGWTTAIIVDDVNSYIEQAKKEYELDREIAKQEKKGEE